MQSTALTTLPLKKLLRKGKASLHGYMEDQAILGGM